VAENFWGGCFVLKDNVLITYEWGGVGDKNTGVNLADGSWHHVVLTQTSGAANGFKFYVDGSLVYTSTYTVNAQNTGAHIGAEGNGGGSQFFNGAIDSIGVWSAILTSTEITSLYNSGNGLEYPFASSASTAKNLLLLGIG
jgi:hypothetical protein